MPIANVQLEKDRAVVDRHRCFISYHEADKREVERFIDTYQDAFLEKIVGAYDYEPISSNDEEYIKRRIREDCLAKTTVTIVLIGVCTWSRKFVDWEIASTLRNDPVNKRSGLLGIVLPSSRLLLEALANDPNAHWGVPKRLYVNACGLESTTYANVFYDRPTSTNVLMEWIHNAFVARDSKSEYIRNSDPLMTQNEIC